jgi:alanyl-tRNA synthetase
LSQAFVELFNWATISFHLGTADSTIDLAAESMTRDNVEQAEALANRVVQDNRPVAICYVDQEQAASAGLRKPTERSGDIRIIDIAGFDRSACGGTHVRLTGEIGPILITGIERVKKQSRVHFLCGNRVLQYARQANRTLETISQTVSAAPFDTAAGVRTIWDELQKSRKHVEDLESRLTDYEAAAYPVNDGIATGTFQDRGIESLKMLASRICARPGAVAILIDTAEQLRIVIARSADLTVDAAGVLKKVLERFGGRGGGRPNFAQGGGLAADSPQTVLDFAVSALRA